MRSSKIRMFYTPEMSFNGGENYSKSPSKPKRFVNYLKKNNVLEKMFTVDNNFEPFDQKDFLVAHTKEYVKSFFYGGLKSQSNGLDWSEEFADSIRYTNSSLYNAIRYAILKPSQITMSPTSGFHHARPDSGGGFCTFSGQVIASMKIFEEFGIAGCYFDLDGHFGNSIEDSRSYVKGLNMAIPKYANINPNGVGDMYLLDLKRKLEIIKKKIIVGDIGYVVWCHGADSHKDDNLGCQLSTNEWLYCTEMFVEFVKDVEAITRKPFPITLSLFGGYRKKYDEVLKLHYLDSKIIQEQLCLTKKERV